MGENAYELIIVIAGLALYIWSKWINYSCEICEILGVRKYSEVDGRMEELKAKICDQLPDVPTQKQFFDTYDSLEKKIKQALYLKKVERDLNRPQWMS